MREIDRDPDCPTCGSYQVWVECSECGGEGERDDLHEHDPLWYGPDDTAICEQCLGKGGWWVCPVCYPIAADEV